MDPYQVLGVAPTASLGEAEAAYHRLLRRHHPDLHQGGTPDELRAAELRTRALNAAIRSIRLRDTGLDQGTAVRPSTRKAPTATDPRVADAWAWSADPGRGRARPDAPSVPCPLCGLPFATSPALRAHVTAVHDVRLEGRARRRARRRRLVPALSFPVWALVPLNATAAVLTGLVARSVTGDLAVSVWAGAVAMAPTAMRLLTGGR